MRVAEFTVGPILGYVEPTRARIFGRADAEWVEDENKRRGLRRCFCVARVRKADGDEEFGPPVFAKALPHFDLTGVIFHLGLVEDTRYEYQAGWIFSEGELPCPAPPEVLDWSEIETRVLQTGSSDPAAPRSVVFGSCRYLLRLFGGYVFEERGDKTFRSVREQIEQGQQIDALVMMGDQIYADDLRWVSPDTGVDAFLARYREAFSQPHLAALMATVPTYMTLDDHEIEDNWPHAASPADMQVKYPAAMHAYSIYQMSHSPLPQLNAAGDALARMPHHFWYSFSDGCCEFFVMDTRTERREQEEIISQSQMGALKHWLADGSGRVKVIVTSVPLLPDFRHPSDDKWSGFIAQRDEILNFVYDQRVRRVVTLSGDVHCSMSVELTSMNDPDFKVISLVSSPFYWPYPHPSRKSFQLEGPLTSQSPYGFRLSNGGPIVTTENFTRMDVSSDQVDVTVFGRKGEVLVPSRRLRF